MTTTLIKLSNSPESILVCPKSLEALTKAGAINHAFFLNLDGKGNKYVKLKLKSKSTSAARLITKAPEGSRVVFTNGNRLDLRMSNLKVIRKINEGEIYLRS